MIMLKSFQSSFKEFSRIENLVTEIKKVPFGYTELLTQLGGKSFDNGLYSIHTFNDSIKWTNILSQNFEKFKDEILSFGHDWMGRQFCVSTKSSDCIYMFDPATQEDFHVEENIFDFHNKTLTDSKVNNLASDLFEEALMYFKISNINYQQCLGFKTPLFLNGEEEVSNYDIYDLEVYWDLEYQLYQQVKNVSDGTRINNITVNLFENK